MADTIFQRVAQNVPGALRQTPQDIHASREWFRQAAQKVKNVNVNQMMNKEPWRLVPRLDKSYVGRMVMFFYDAKLKEELPYWDKFPLIFVVDMTNDGFYGINLHYLPPVLRAKMMDALYNIVNNHQYDQTTKLRMSYSILKNASQLKYFKPCFKRYLGKHVRSRFLYVSPVEWDSALFLPTERFQKASKQQVWVESTKQINNLNTRKRR